MSVGTADALGIFTGMLAVATLLAALQELRERRWAWPSVGTHLAQGGVVAHETVGVVRWANRAALLLRVGGPVLLLAGAAPRVAVVLTFVGLAVALLLRFKHNTAFMAAGAALVACGPTVVVRGGTDLDGPAGWTLAGVAVLLVGLYVGGALTKAQSEQFRTGSTILLVATTRLPRLAPRLEAWPWRVWQGAASVVVVAEIALVVLLAVPGGLVAALVVGLLLHSLLATIQPGRLVPFQVATLGAYPAAAAGFALLW